MRTEVAPIVVQKTGRERKKVKIEKSFFFGCLRTMLIISSSSDPDKRMDPTQEETRRTNGRVKIEFGVGGGGGGVSVGKK